MSVGTPLASLDRMEPSSLTVDGDDEALHYAAILKLRRGAALWSSWEFHFADAGTLISVGASADCDWQVAAHGVQPISLLFTGNALLVRRQDLDEDASRNSAALWPGWLPLEQGDLLDLGACCIEVTRVPAGASGPTGSSQTESTEALRELLAARTGLLRLRHAASRSGEPGDEPDHATAVATEVDIDELAGPAGLDASCDTDDKVWATVLEEARPSQGYLYYLPYAALVALAYVAWVILLESI